MSLNAAVSSSDSGKASSRPLIKLLATTVAAFKEDAVARATKDFLVVLGSNSGQRGANTDFGN